MRAWFIEMKKKFSKSWKGSRQPRKQRKYIANAPLHLKRKFMSAMLGKELRKKYGVRNIGVRKGDEVAVMKGKFKKKKGKITEVNMRKMRVAVEGLQMTKKDGAKVNAWFHPSNLKIVNLNVDDMRRLKRLKKVKSEEKKETKTENKKEKENAHKEK